MVKKILGATLGFVAVLVISVTANAQASSSYDTTMTPATKPTSGYEGGFFVGSPDGDYKIKFGARVDTMFAWGSSKVPDVPGTAQLNEGADTLTFQLRRAQVTINPSYKNFSIFAMLGHGTSSNRLTGAQGTYWVASGTYSFNDHISLKGGYEDPAFDLMSVMSSKRMTMVDPPITVTQQDGEAPVWVLTNAAGDVAVPATTITRPSFGLPTQLGVFLDTNFFNEKLQASVAMGNGNDGSDHLNANKRFTYTGRVSYTILGDNFYGDMTDLAYHDTPALAIGIGGALESDPGYGDNGSGTTVKLYNWRADVAADIAFRYRGFSLNLSGMGARLKVGPGAVWEAGEKYLDDVGYLATAAMFVIPKKVELQGWGAQIFREGPDNNVYEFGGGLNVYLVGHNAQFQIDYSRVLDYDTLLGTVTGGTHDSINRIRARMQMYF